MFENIKSIMKDGDSKDKKNKILVIDGMNLFIRSYAANPSVNSNGEHMGGLLGSLLGIGSFVDMFKPDKCVVVFDGKDGSKRRRTIYPEYKQNRGNGKGFRFNRPEHLELIPEEDIEKNFTTQLSKLLELLRMLPVALVVQNYMEADDVIAIISDIYNTVNDYITIVSADKDFLQLVNENIKVYSPTKKIIYNVDKVLEEFSIHPNNFALYKSILGDASDNIHGVNGWGHKTIIKHLGQILSLDRQVTIDELKEYIDKLDSKYKCLKEFNQHSHTLLLNEQIINLKNVDILNTTSILNVKNIIDRYDCSSFIKYKIFAELTKLGIVSNFKNLDEFLQKFSNLYFKNIKK